MARKQRIGWGRGPNERDAERADLRGTETVVAPYDFATPPVEELLQAETGFPDRAIPVEVVAPVQVQEAPSISGGMFTRSIDTTGRRLLPTEPRRKTATIMPLSADVRFGTTQAEAASAGAGVVWPGNVPYVYGASSELWVAAVTGTVSVGVAVEHFSR